MYSELVVFLILLTILETTGSVSPGMVDSCVESSSTMRCHAAQTVSVF
jgi:hypothetical protein